jgi:hypothetical protein
MRSPSDLTALHFRPQISNLQEKNKSFFSSKFCDDIQFGKATNDKFKAIRRHRCLKFSSN